jgi:hypothetical protein
MVGVERSGDCSMNFTDYEKVRDSTLSSKLKLLLYTLLTYADRNETCYPSVATLATGTGFVKSTVREGMNELESSHIVSCPHGRRGGRMSNKYHLHLDRLPTMTSPAPGGVSPPPTPPDRGAVASCASRSQTDDRRAALRPSVPTAPAIGAEPSIHLSREQSMEPSTQAVNAASADGNGQEVVGKGWKDGQCRPPTPRPVQDVLLMLDQAGVRGRNLHVLGRHPKITPEVVREELRSIKADPNVRNQAAVLTARLAKRYSVKLGGPRPRCAEDRKTIADLEQLKRVRTGKGTAGPRDAKSVREIIDDLGL